MARKIEDCPYCGYIKREFDNWQEATVCSDCGLDCCDYCLDDHECVEEVDKECC